MGQRKKTVSAVQVLAKLQAAVTVNGETMRPLLRAGILTLLEMPDDEQMAVAGRVARLASEVPLMGPVMAFEVLLAVEQLKVRNAGWGCGELQG